MTGLPWYIRIRSIRYRNGQPPPSLMAADSGTMEPQTPLRLDLVEALDGQ